MNMKVLAVVAVGALGAVSGALLMAGGAGAGNPTPITTWSAGPLTGGPGTIINVSGTGCQNDFIDQQAQVVLSTAAGAVIASATFPVSEGSWSGQITVPEGTPPGTYDVQAFCIDDESGGGSLAVGPPAGTLFTYAPSFVFTIPGAAAPAADAPAAPVAVVAAPRTAG